MDVTELLRELQSGFHAYPDEIDHVWVKEITFYLFLLGMPIADLVFWIRCWARLSAEADLLDEAACLSWSIKDFVLPKTFPASAFEVRAGRNLTPLQMLAAYVHGGLEEDPDQMLICQRAYGSSPLDLIKDRSFWANVLEFEIGSNLAWKRPHEYELDIPTFFDYQLTALLVLLEQQGFDFLDIALEHRPRVFPYWMI